MKGRHQTTCKAGKRSIALIKTIEGVKDLVIGRSHGGKGLHQAYDGAIKLQKSTLGGITGVMQTSKGVQDITILLESSADEAQVRSAIEQKMHT